MAVNKHQQKSDATRRKLLEAALRIFARDGFEAARLEDIAAESGHTRGAFYANFDTKEDLFFALLEQQASERLKDLQQRLEKHDTTPARLRTLRACYLERAKDCPSMLLTLEFKLFALRHPKMRARLAAAHRRIRASLNYELLTKLLPSHPDAEQKEMDKILLEVLLVGLVLEHAYDPKRLSAKQTAATLGRAFDLLIAPQMLARATAVPVPSASPAVSKLRVAADRRAAR
jgi:AcrR family transcriptional regulator